VIKSIKFTLLILLTGLFTISTVKANYQLGGFDGWYFRDGILYFFPVNSILSAEGYIIVAQNPSHIKMNGEIYL
jgi:hypothetical protein